MFYKINFKLDFAKIKSEVIYPPKYDYIKELFSILIVFLKIEKKNIIFNI